MKKIPVLFALEHTKLNTLLSLTKHKTQTNQ